MAARPPAGGWLQGRTVRKGGAASNTARSSSSSTPTVQSATNNLYGGGVKDPSGRTAEYFSIDDQCPVCKSDRYLNPKLRLLVSTPCYHKMCESCIDRLFTLGPAPCPECNITLRKLAFTPQTFEDLGVEKEVSIRKRLAREFNKRREDFPDLRSYNDYLQMVEDIAFNLINNIDIPETEARIVAYRAENAALIELNIQREQDYVNQLKEQEDFERREREQRAQELRLEEESERQERELEKQNIINGLESTDKDAIEVIRKARAKMRKHLKREEEERKAQAQARLLRSRVNKGPAVKDVPHVPLMDDWYAYEDMFHLRQVYNDPASEAVRRDKEGVMRAGGYMVSQAWERAIRTSVAGLDITPLGS